MLHIPSDIKTSSVVIFFPSESGMVKILLNLVFPPPDQQDMLNARTRTMSLVAGLCNQINLFLSLLYNRKEILSPKEHSICAKTAPRQVFGFDAPFADSGPYKLPGEFNLPHQEAMTSTGPRLVNSPASMQSSAATNIPQMVPTRKVSPPINTPNFGYRPA